MSERPYIHPSCLAGTHIRVDLYTDPTAGLVANDCGVCWPEEAERALAEGDAS